MKLYLWHLISHLSCFFFPRPAILVAEGDGWTSLCSFADRQTGSMSVIHLPLLCVDTRVQHILCTNKFFTFEEAFWVKVERDHGELILWSVTAVGEGCWPSVALTIHNQAWSGPVFWRGDDTLCPGHICSIQLFRLQNRVVISTEKGRLLIQGTRRKSAPTEVSAKAPGVLSGPLIAL